jgi:hypothetical protein
MRTESTDSHDVSVLKSFLCTVLRELEFKKKKKETGKITKREAS